MSGILQGLLASFAAAGGPFLYSWGFASPFRILSGLSPTPSSPVQVGSDSWTDASGDNTCNHTLLISSSGGLWASGVNSDGQLGTGNTTSVSAPVQIGALTNWSVISAGRNSSGAIKTDGTLWMWGYNASGNLGLGDITNRSSPTQVGALTTWAQVSVSTQTIAVKTDGTLWAWGANNQGNLGLGDTTNRSSPTQVGALTTWAYPGAGGAASGAVKTDGTLWSWGANSQGQLGLGDLTGRSSPAQVGALTSWDRFYPGDDNSMFLRTDNNLFTAGKNDKGQLGIGTQNNYVGASSPVQVGGAVWASGRRPRALMHAIRTDGTLWGWGENGGAIGDGTATDRSSPVQVGSDTDWLLIAAMNDAPVGIRQG